MVNVDFLNPKTTKIMSNIIKANSQLVPIKREVAIAKTQEPQLRTIFVDETTQDELSRQPTERSEIQFVAPEYIQNKPIWVKFLYWSFYAVREFLCLIGLVLIEFIKWVFRYTPKIIKYIFRLSKKVYRLLKPSAIKAEMEKVLKAPIRQIVLEEQAQKEGKKDEKVTFLNPKILDYKPNSY
jgi:hypothetical protein